MSGPTELQHPRWSRRQLLEIGGIGMFGLSLEGVARCQAAARGPDRKKVVFIFLPGGPPQHETFDPKPDAVDTIRGEFGVTATRTPGVLFSEHLPLLASRSDRYAIIRSLHHRSNDHIAGTTIMTSGDTAVPPLAPPDQQPGVEDTPGIAALAGYYCPAEHSLPGSAVVPEYIGRGTGTGQIIPGQGGGRLGAAADPWLVQAASNCLGWGACPHCFDDGDDDAVFAFGLEHNHSVPGPVFEPPSLGVANTAASARLKRRVSLLEAFEQRRRSLDRVARATSLDHFRHQALALLTSPRVQRALQIGNERRQMLERYGQNKFGWSLLLTRRLLQAGVNMVQVSLGRNGTWDTHRRAFPLLKDYLLPPTDRAVSAFLDDLDQCGLLDETLVVMCGEFGRTPKLSSPPGRRPGRDHWGPLQSVLVAGAGVRGGVVVGASDKIGGYVKDTPKTPEDLAATMFQALGIAQGTTYRDLSGQPHPVYLGSPITELYG